MTYTILQTKNQTNKRSNLVTTPQKLKNPESLHLESIPANTPEIQPAERLQPIINEPISNQNE